MWSLLRLCLLEPELRWHFIYINNYCPESPLGLPWSNQTSNALKIAHHVLLMADYKMYCYSLHTSLLIRKAIVSTLNGHIRLLFLCNNLFEPNYNIAHVWNVEYGMVRGENTLTHTHKKNRGALNLFVAGQQPVQSTYLCIHWSKWIQWIMCRMIAH